MTKNIAEGIHLLSINVEGLLFEGMWEMPKGVTLNSYIVKGEETAIIDGFCGWDGIPESLFALLEEVEVPLESIKYLVINHMEPDHSGWIEDFKKIHSDFDIYCSAESAKLLEAFYGHTERVNIVKDGDVLELGAGKKLTFYKTPNVHWPDTMSALEEQTGTLFVTDLFGSFHTLDQHLRSEITEEFYRDHYEREQLRYYASILATFTPMLKTAVEKLKKLPIKMICNGHGLVWDTDVEFIMDEYLRYASYQRGKAKEKITIIWGSMYGNTEKMVHQMENYLTEKGIPYASLQMPQTDEGTLLKHCWESEGIVVAAPTYEYKMFPPVAAALDECGRKRIQGKKALFTGSFGWSGGAVKEYDEVIKRNMMNWETLEYVEFNGKPTSDSKQSIVAALDSLISRIKE